MKIASIVLVSETDREIGVVTQLNKAVGELSEALSCAIPVHQLFSGDLN
jgi:hypothetical protein